MLETTKPSTVRVFRGPLRYAPSRCPGRVSKPGLRWRQCQEEWRLVVLGGEGLYIAWAVWCVMADAVPLPAWETRIPAERRQQTVLRFFIHSAVVVAVLVVMAAGRCVTGWILECRAAVTLARLLRYRLSGGAVCVAGLEEVTEEGVRWSLTCVDRPIGTPSPEMTFGVAGRGLFLELCLNSSPARSLLSGAL
ncbi:hypothetical protein O3P69_001313 [Scylla paramamosain]|uniref:Uncharacterized protein n=1 Tax=Scylla paramamosain TaxID=85552 RepID=A0AAW0UTW7_SCYPA